MADSNNVAAYTFSNVSNTQRENANTTITTENLYKSDELVDAVKNSTINNAEYYTSNTAIASDTQVSITSNLETFTHSSNVNETVTHTRNGNFEQK